MDATPLFVKGLGADAEASLLHAVEDLKVQRVQDPARAAGEAARPGLAVVALNGDPEAAFRLVGNLASAGTRVAVVGEAKDPDLILRAMRAGAREYVLAAEPERIELALRNMARPAATTTTGAVTAIYPAKGGMGATTLATNLAAALATRSARACVVDLDLQLGDVLSFLDMTSGYAISDVMANLRRLDRDLLDASVPRHKSGIAVLAQGEKLDDAEKIEPESLGRFFGLLRQHYGHVVVDGIRGFDEMALAALDASDRILLVVTQEVPAVRNAQRCVEIFRRLGYDDQKVRLVVNRFHSRSNVTRDVVAETVGLPVTAVVANDFRTLNDLVNRGETIAGAGKRSAAARDLDALADALGDGGARQAAPWWKRLVGGARGAR